MPGGDDEPFVAPDGEDEPADHLRQQREETLSLVRVVLEREMGRSELDEDARGAVERLLEMVRSGDVERLEESYRYLFSQVGEPSPELANARSMLERLFSAG